MLTWIDLELEQAVEAVQRAEFPADFADADAAAARRRGGGKREGGTLFKVAARFSEEEEEELSTRKEEGVAGGAEDVLWCQRESGNSGGVEEGSVSESGRGGGGHTLRRAGGARGQARILHLGFHEGLRKEIDFLSCMLGTQFTCFTGTKVQILTQKRCAARSANQL
jgi:hypothetical protein